MCTLDNFLRVIFHVLFSKCTCMRANFMTFYTALCGEFYMKGYMHEVIKITYVKLHVIAFGMASYEWLSCEIL